MLLLVLLLAFSAAREFTATDFVNFDDSSQTVELPPNTVPQQAFAVDTWGGMVTTVNGGACAIGGNVRGYASAPGTGYVAAAGFAAATGVQLLGSPPWSWAAIWAAQATVTQDPAGGLNVSASAAAAALGTLWVGIEEVDCGATSNDDNATVYRALLFKDALWALNTGFSKPTGTRARWCTFIGAGVPLTPFANLRVGYTAAVSREILSILRFNSRILKRHAKYFQYLHNWPYTDPSHCLRTTFYTAGASGAIAVVANKPSFTDSAGVQMTFETAFVGRVDGSGADTSLQWRVGTWASVALSDASIPQDSKNFLASKYGASFAVRRIRLSTQVPGRCGATEVCTYDPDTGSTLGSDSGVVVNNLSSTTAYSTLVLLLALAALVL